MARRVGEAFALLLAGLLCLAFAEIPPGLPWRFSRPYTHVPVDARVVDLEPVRYAGKDTGVSLLHYRYVFDGRPYDATWRGTSSIPLPSDVGRIGGLRPGDWLRAWVDPDRPEAASLHRERRLGNDERQILAGLVLIVAAVVVAVRPRRRD